MANKKYDMVIFDWDGCLFKSNLTLIDVIKEELALEGIIVSEEVIIDRVFGDWLWGFKTLGVADPNFLVNKVYSRLSERLYGCGLNDGAKEILSKLENAGVIVVLSAPLQREFVYPHIQRLGVNKYIKALLTDDYFKYGKPNPEVLLEVIDKFGVSKNKVLLVGNSAKDVLLAKNAGLDVAIFYPPGNRKIYRKKEIEEAEPTYLVEKLNILGEIIIS